MKKTMAVFGYSAYGGNTVIDLTSHLNTSDRIAQIVKGGVYFQVSEPVEVEFPELPAEDKVVENLRALDRLEAAKRVELEAELQSIRNRRAELRQITFDGAEKGQTFVPRDRSLGEAVDQFDDGIPF